MVHLMLSVRNNVRQSAYQKIITAIIETARKYKKLVFLHKQNITIKSVLI